MYYYFFIFPLSLSVSQLYFLFLFVFLEGTQEHVDISGALSLVRELISAVDMRVSEREQSQWLNDVLGRMESKSLARLKSGDAFRKHDMTSGRMLLHHGPLLWKTATGRLKGQINKAVQTTSMKCYFREILFVLYHFTLILRLFPSSRTLVTEPSPESYTSPISKTIIKSDLFFFFSFLHFSHKGHLMDFPRLLYLYNLKRKPIT